MSLGEFIPTSNTKLLLHLNGNSNDSSGNSNNGTNTNITFSQVNGRFGQGAGFNGSSSKIIIANESQFDFERTDSFSISFWINFTSTVEKIIISKLASSGTYNGYEINSVNGVIHTYFNGNTTFPTQALQVRTTTTCNDGKWHHVGVTYAGTSNASGVTIYIDGASQPLNIINNVTLTYTMLNNIPINIGCRNSSSGFIAMKFDECIIENRVWTAQEVKKYYTNSLGRYAAL